MPRDNADETVIGGRALPSESAGTDAAPDDQVRSTLPAAIGGYWIERLIGVGGMSRVYEARSRGDSTPVALKVLDARVAAESAMLRRFQREAQAIQSLAHDHIVPLFAYGNDLGAP